MPCSKEENGVQMLDAVMVICWSVVYVLILCNYVRCPKDNRACIPFLAVSMNLGWEVNAAITSGGFWGHLLWLVLDIGIFVLSIDIVRRKSIYHVWFAGLYFLITVLLMQVFYYLFRYEGGMLISSFAINLLMSLLFVYKANQIPWGHKTIIAFLKAIGSLCATIEYGGYLSVILLLGIAVFFVDLYYLACCLEEKAQRGRK